MIEFMLGAWTGGVLAVIFLCCFVLSKGEEYEINEQREKDMQET